MFAEGSTDSETWANAGNRWIRENKGDPKNLARDIVARGMYSPYWSQFLGEDADGKRTYYVDAGKHRIYSLLQLDAEAPIDKRFLFTYYQGDHMRPLEKPVDLYLFDKQTFKVITVTATKVFDCVLVMDHFICFMNDCFHENALPPLGLVNDEQKFARFMETGTIF